MNNSAHWVLQNHKSFQEKCLQQATGQLFCERELTICRCCSEINVALQGNRLAEKASGTGRDVGFVFYSRETLLEMIEICLG